MRGGDWVWCGGDILLLDEVEDMMKVVKLRDVRER